MKTRKAFAVLAICTLSAIGISEALSPHQAKAQSVDIAKGRCQRAIAGTYLTTITTDGNFASRSLITLTKDGNIFVADSNQGGVPGAFNPFTSSQGAWKCTANQEITATVFNFSLPGTEGSTGDIARTNYRLTFEPETRTVQGTATLRFFDLQSDAIGSDAPVAGTFSLTGQRVTAD